MSEYKFVQWGKGIPVDYQRLGQMVSNEQYLKDKIDPSPKGVLAWKESGSIAIVNPSGALQAVTGFQNLSFDVDEDRCITATFAPGQISTTLNASQECRYSIYIDGVSVASAGTGSKVDSQLAASPCVWVSETALSKGTHTISVFVQATAATYSLSIGGNSNYVSLIVRDEGKYVQAWS